LQIGLATRQNNPGFTLNFDRINLMALTTGYKAPDFQPKRKNGDGIDKIKAVLAS
jgi:hypothetical protein